MLALNLTAGEIDPVGLAVAESATRFPLAQHNEDVIKMNDSLPKLVAGTLTVALACTVLRNEGWLIWLPVLPAPAVVGVLVPRIG